MCCAFIKNSGEQTRVFKVKGNILFVYLFIMCGQIEVKHWPCGAFRKLLFIYTDQNYKRNTFVFAPIFHELNSKI